MTNKRTCDQTIEEIHRTRERLAAKFGGNIKAILDDARQRQAASGRPIWKGTKSEENRIEDEES